MIVTNPKLGVPLKIAIFFLKLIVILITKKILPALTTKIILIFQEDGRFNLQAGSLVRATYMGNDPITTAPIYNIHEERAFNP